MNQKIVSQLDHENIFVGEAIADESPLEPGVFLLPAGAVDLPPPTFPAGKRARYDNGRFVIEYIPAQPEPPEKTDEQLAADARYIRAQLLAGSDWTVLPDAPVTAEQREAWLQYRQALRDVTGQPSFPRSIEWPTRPA